MQFLSRHVFSLDFKFPDKMLQPVQLGSVYSGIGKTQ